MSRTTGASQIRSLWDRLSPMPGGKWIFSRVLGRIIPYTGSIRPRVEKLEPGFARIALKDTRRVRNHLNSIHAIALANLAEVTSGLAMHYDLPAELRAILTGLDIEYVKKARGLLHSEARVDLPPISENTELTVKSVIRDADGDEVATATARWLVGPRDERKR